MKKTLLIGTLITFFLIPNLACANMFGISVSSLSPTITSKLEYKIKLNQKTEKSRDAMAQKTLVIIQDRLANFDLQYGTAAITKVGKETHIVVDVTGKKTEIANVKKMLPTKSSLCFKENISKSTVDMPQKWRATQLTNKYVKDVRAEKNDYGYQIAIKFDKKGTALFQKLTKKNIGKQLAIFIDNKIISSPTVNEEISGGEAVISGNFTEEEVKEFALIIGMPQLPSTLTKVK